MDIDEPEEEDLYKMGTLTKVKQMLKLPNGTIRVLVEGVQRAELEELMEEDGYFAARLRLFEEETTKDVEDEALMRTMLQYFEQYIKISKKYRMKHMQLFPIWKSRAEWPILLLPIYQLN